MCRAERASEPTTPSRRSIRGHAPARCRVAEHGATGNACRRCLQVWLLALHSLPVLLLGADPPPVPPEGASNIAATAQVVTQPDVEPAMRKLLTDGDVDPKRGLAFPVKSSGPGVITFRFYRPRRVQALYFSHPHKWYLIKTFRVLADLTGKGTYDHELARGSATRTEYPSWEGVSWKPTTVHGLRLEPLSGFAGGNRAYPALGEIMVFGDALPTDHEDAVAAGNAVRVISRVRTIRSSIDLSGNTRPVAILLPEDPAYQGLGAALAAELEQRTGAKAAVTSAAAEALPAEHNVIAVGNVNSNEHMARLYFNRYTYADSLYPGTGEFVLRTVFEPYPWHGDGDVIAIGCGDVAGAERGVSELLARLESGTASLPYTLAVSAPSPLAESGPPTQTFSAFRTVAERYLKTGHAADAEATIACLEVISHAYEQAARESRPAPHIAWPDEMASFFAVAAWDAFEEYPGLSSDQRLRFTRVFMQFMDDLTEHVSAWTGLTGPQWVAYNHTVYPLSGVYAAARYFRAYYQLDRTEDYLARCGNAFRSQATSWKPSEDADIYLDATMEPCTRYWLGEWDLRFLDEVYPTYAEYQVGVRDSTGLNSGFGDSGLGRHTDRHASVLALALWHTRDPRYAWLLQRSAGPNWQNPLRRDVQPQPDTAHVGTRVFPLTRPLFAWTAKGSVSRVPRRAANVPFAETFDKISFRESWEPDAQYLLLDGYGHGHHLHFDTNAIITFVDRGKRWLLDHDYLIRNSTEHNMISIIRNGRSDQLVPSCARLGQHLGGSHLSAIRSTVRDYLGQDWERALFWRRGESFVVMDRVLCRQAGELAVDCTWKVEDRGTEDLLNANLFRVRRPEIEASSRDVLTIDDGEAGGGKAILLSATTSRWGFMVELPPAEYQVVLWAYGLNGSSDSLYVTTEGSPDAECHVPKLHYGRSRATWAEGGQSTTVRFVRGSRQLVSVRLRERPPVRIDRVLFTDAAGKPVREFEAEELASATGEFLHDVPADRFWLKCADPVTSHLRRTTPRGITAPVCKLWQRRAATLDEGQSLEFANLLYTDRAGAALDLAIHRLLPYAVLITGERPALCATAPVSLDGVRSDAELLFITREHIGYCGGESLEIGGLRFALSGLQGQIEVPSGQRDTVGAALGRLGAAGLIPRGPAVPPPQARALWSYGLSARPERLRIADLDGDGRAEILVAAGSQAVALGSGGELLWESRVTGRCNDVNAGELTSDPGLEVVLAATDCQLHVLSARGQPLAQVENRGTPRYAKTGDMAHEPLAAAILNLAGVPRVFVADTGYKLQVYDSQLREVWEQWRGCTFGAREFHTADVNRDGKLELFATDHYGALVAFDHEGRKKAQYYTSIGDMQAVLGDMDGDGNVEALFGSSTGDLRCSRLLADTPFSGASEALFSFNNYGYPVNRLRLVDLTGNGKREALVASGTGYLYVLDAAGNIQWQYRAEAAVIDVVELPKGAGRIALADRSGTITVLNDRGGVVRELRLSSRPVLVATCSDSLVVATESAVVALPLP